MFLFGNVTTCNLKYKPPNLCTPYQKIINFRFYGKHCSRTRHRQDPHSALFPFVWCPQCHLVHWMAESSTGFGEPIENQFSIGINIVSSLICLSDSYSSRRQRFLFWLWTCTIFQYISTWNDKCLWRLMMALLCLRFEMCISGIVSFKNQSLFLSKVIHLNYLFSLFQPNSTKKCPRMSWIYDFLDFS